MICVMFKTWYMGYGHPSIVRNPAVGYGIQLLTTAPFMQVLRGRAHHQGCKVASRADRGQMGQESKLITHHE